MLFIGEEVGRHDEDDVPEIDIAVDPLEGTNLVAHGQAQRDHGPRRVGEGRPDPRPGHVPREALRRAGRRGQGRHPGEPDREHRTDRRGARPAGQRHHDRHPRPAPPRVADRRGPRGGRPDQAHHRRRPLGRDLLRGVGHRRPRRHGHRRRARGRPDRGRPALPGRRDPGPLPLPQPRGEGPWRGDGPRRRGPRLHDRGPRLGRPARVRGDRRDRRRPARTASATSAAAPGPTRCRWPTRRSRSASSTPSTCSTGIGRRRFDSEGAHRHGRGTIESWRWAVAASRCRPTTAASTRSCSLSPGNGLAASGLAICFVPTAGADDDWGVARFYGAFARSSEASHLALFGRTVEDVDAFLLDQDLVFVGGGNTVNMLAIWRAARRRPGPARGVAGRVSSMSGMSAGGVCWFEGFTTDSFGPTLRPVRDGLGVLRGSFIPALPRRGAAPPALPPAGRRRDAARRLRRRRRRGARLPRDGAERGRLVAGRRGARTASNASTERPARRVCRRATSATDPPATSHRRPSGRSRGRRPTPPHARGGPARSRPSRTSRAARAAARGRRAGRGRTAAPRRAGAGRRGRSASVGSSRAGSAGRSTAMRWRPKSSRSRSSSRGPQRARSRRPNARSSCLSATSNATAPVAGSGPDGHVELRPPRSGTRAGRSTPTGAVA